MSIKVLLADDSEVMLNAIHQALTQEPRVRVIGTACTFVEMMQMIGDLRPDVLLFDLHLPDQLGFTPEFIRSQLARVPCTLAVSVDNSEEAKTLADSYGAVALLDKMNLYNELIPAVMGCTKWHEWVSPTGDEPLPPRDNAKPSGAEIP